MVCTVITRVRMAPTAHRCVISSVSAVGCRRVLARTVCVSALQVGPVLSVVRGAPVGTMGPCVGRSACHAPKALELVMQKQGSATACQVTQVTPALMRAQLVTMATTVSCSATVITVVYVVTLTDRVVAHQVGQA